MSAFFTNSSLSTAGPGRQGVGAGGDAGGIVWVLAADAGGIVWVLVAAGGGGLVVCGRGAGGMNAEGL